MQFSVFVQELLELKRLQIRAPKANEEVIVKQLTETFIYISYIYISISHLYVYIIYISTSRENREI